MQTLLIVYILPVVIVQVYCDCSHSTGIAHKHGGNNMNVQGLNCTEIDKQPELNESQKAAKKAKEAAEETAEMVEQTKKQLQTIAQAANAVPRNAGASNDNGFNANYNFLWHSDATILNYLARNRGNGGQAVRVSSEDIIRAGERNKPAQVIPEHDKTAPMETVSSNDGAGFKSDYNFLWHSDATILNYLAQKNENGGQAVPARNAAKTGHHHGEEEENGDGHHDGGHFGKHESLFRVLAQV